MRQLSEFVIEGSGGDRQLIVILLSSFALALQWLSAVSDIL